MYLSKKPCKQFTKAWLMSSYAHYYCGVITSRSCQQPVPSLYLRHRFHLWVHRTLLIPTLPLPKGNVSFHLAMFVSIAPFSHTEYPISQLHPNLLNNFLLHYVQHCIRVESPILLPITSILSSRFLLLSDYVSQKKYNPSILVKVT